MIKKIIVSVFLTLFALIMTNVSLADNQTMCTQQYQPVCGEVQVQCIKAPCYPVQQTFGNRCEANVAGATNVQEGTCDSQSQRVVDTSWKLTSLNDQPVAEAVTLSFGASTFSAHICNSKSGGYSVSGNVFSVQNVISTMMACSNPLATYEGAFDLSGARYNILGSKLVIDTFNGDRFQWVKVVTYPPLPTISWKERMYGLLLWQIHQIERRQGYDTVEEKRAFVSSLIEKINDIMIRSSMTRAQNSALMFLKNGLQYYYDRIS